MKLNEIEKLCREKLWTRFPYADLRRVRESLSRNEQKQVRYVNPDLDEYLAFIVGYGTSATTLMIRPIEELRRALPVLDKNFYESYPAYEVLRSRITKGETPDLFSHLEAADVLRNELAMHIRKNLHD
jgi:hypothetical protein